MKVPPLKWIVVNAASDIQMLPPPSANFIEVDASDLLDALDEQVEVLAEFTISLPPQLARRDVGDPVVQHTLHPLLPPGKVIPEWN